MAKCLDSLALDVCTSSSGARLEKHSQRWNFGRKTYGTWILRPRTMSDALAPDMLDHDLRRVIIRSAADSCRVYCFDQMPAIVNDLL